MRGIEIRKRLSEILHKNKSYHEKLIKELQKKSSKSGSMLDCQLYKDSENIPYGVCHNFTLDFYQQIDGFRIDDNIQDCIAFRKLEKEKLICLTESILNADIVVYLQKANQFPMHIHSSKVLNGKVISRWGSGNVWIHNINHVPSIYEYENNEVKNLFYTVPNKKNVNTFLKQNLTTTSK